MNHSMEEFITIKNTYAVKLNRTLTQLENWNDVYMDQPPITDEGRIKYRSLQFNMVKRNEGIANLLQGMKKVTKLTKDIQKISDQIDEVSKYFDVEFCNIDYVLRE